MRTRALRPFLCLVLLSSVLIAADKPDGRELFTREWLPDDPRSAAGDGLGPVFNDTSCAACHNQGGIGGAGPIEKNAQVASAFGADESTGPVAFEFRVSGNKVTTSRKPDPPARGGKGGKGVDKDRAARERKELEELHLGLLTARSVVLQRSGTEPKYDEHRQSIVERASPLNTAAQYQRLLKQFFGGKAGPFAGFNFASELAEALGDAAEKTDLPKLSDAQRDDFLRITKGLAGGRLTRHDFGDVVLLLSERNSPPLFGTGLIDTIPESALLAAAKNKHAGYPEVSGRVARLKDGRLGRFGWKAQKSRLHFFVLNACAMELGLEVPGHAQAISPHQPDYKAPGIDLTEKECRELTLFIAHLPQPRELGGNDAKSRRMLREGRKLFEQIGCAACHMPELGEVSGIYSDLLLHDMGPALSDAGVYGAALNATEEEEVKLPLPRLAIAENTKPLRPAEEAKLVGALRQEWRTPPLWGLRDSAPYLHDGRAATLDQAILLHDGEAQRSTRQFLRLSAEERLQLMAFLGSLAAPE